MWKTLSIIASLALLAAGGITFTQIKPNLTAERVQRTNAEGYVAKAQETLKEAKAAEKEREGILDSTKSTLTKSEKERAEAAARKEKILAEFEAENTTKEAAAKDLTDLETRLNDLGGLPQLLQELRAQQVRRGEYDAQIAGKKSGIASAQAKAVAEQRRIAELKQLDQNQQSGSMDPGFRSQVSTVTPDWGFFRIPAGNGSRVVAQARLDVVRGGVLVGRGIVSTVGPSSSSVDIIPGSVAPGDSILPGDSVVVSDVSRAGARPAGTPAAPKPGAPATPKPADPSAPLDPFATPPPAGNPPAAPGTPPADSPAPADTAKPVEPDPNF